MYYFLLGLFFYAIMARLKIKKLVKDYIDLNNNTYIVQQKQLEEQHSKLDKLFTELKGMAEEKEGMAKEKAKLSEAYTCALNKYYTDISCLKKDYEESFSKLQNTYQKELSTRKSSEVRVGQVAEQLLPFLESWPYDPKDFRFIGSPFDAFQLTNDKLLFVEIKTGKSRLSKKQEYVKKLVKEGKVEFVTVRINEDGVCVS